MAEQRIFPQKAIIRAQSPRDNRGEFAQVVDFIIGDLLNRLSQPNASTTDIEELLEAMESIVFNPEGFIRVINTITEAAQIMDPYLAETTFVTVADHAKRLLGKYQDPKIQKPVNESLTSFITEMMAVDPAGLNRYVRRGIKKGSFGQPGEVFERVLTAVLQPVYKGRDEFQREPGPDYDLTVAILARDLLIVKPELASQPHLPLLDQAMQTAPGYFTEKNGQLGVSLTR